MKSVLNLISASLLSAVFATSAFANSSHGQRDSDHVKKTEHTHKTDSQKDKQPNKQQQAKKKQKTVKPATDWKIGAKVPETYRSTTYNVGHTKHKLPEPSKNQRWIKVNGDYVLVNVLTHTIIRIVQR